MSSRKVILLGGPDSGKTNYLARLWPALHEGGGALSATVTPDEIKYVEEALSHLHSGGFAPRTNESHEGSISIPLEFVTREGAIITDLVIPDTLGEVWKDAVETNELEPERMAELESAVGAILFVRVLSKLNVAPLDWVNSARLMRLHGEHGGGNDLPTQVMLCELLRLLELTLGDQLSKPRPRLSVAVTAWDLLDDERSAAGPSAYLRREFPLFAGKLEDLDSFDVAIFGVSIVGGDLDNDPAFRSEFLKSDFKSTGYIVVENASTVRRHGDLTLPVAWAAGSQQPRD